MDNINIFGYLGAWVGVGEGGGGGFNNQTGPILVHIYPLFILIYMPNIEAIYMI